MLSWRPLGEPTTYVAYLAGAPSGELVVERFARSYVAHRSGAPHTLLVIFNGFSGPNDPRLTPWRRALEGLAYETIVPREPTLDLGAYRVASREVGEGLCCFLNSFSEILADDWLALLRSAVSDEGVGMAGASGSWGSIRSLARYAAGLGGGYSDVFDDRRSTLRSLAAINARTRAEGSGLDPPRKRRRPARYALGLLDQQLGFANFPARHLRTTGFMVDAAVFESLSIGSPRRKADTYRLESGRRSITSQIEALGLGVRLVDRNAVAYKPADWPSSRTFWQGTQERLLIADKQTAQYEHSSPSERLVLARYAWGELADAEPAVI
jgi:hypothetical protein